MNISIRTGATQTKNARQAVAVFAVFLSRFTEGLSFGASSSAVPERKFTGSVVRRFPYFSWAHQPSNAQRVLLSALMRLQCQEPIRATQCPNNSNFRHQQQPAGSADISASCVGRSFSGDVMALGSADIFHKEVAVSLNMMDTLSDNILN